LYSIRWWADLQVRHGSAAPGTLPVEINGNTGYGKISKINNQAFGNGSWNGSS
jgi:hypothetical protein